MSQFNLMPSSQPPQHGGPIDASPLLTHSDRFLRSRRLISAPPPHFRSAARLLRRASSRRLMLREPSVMVRENAAEQLEERQNVWAYSKPIIALDFLWNLAFFVIAATVLGLSVNESPQVPLRVWIGGYGLQCLFHVVCVGVEYGRRTVAGGFGGEVGFGEEEDRDGETGSMREESGEESEDNELEDQRELGERSRIAMNLESANTVFSFIWWIIGFYWVTGGGESLPCDAPQLYWLCISFLAFDVIFVLICAVIASLIGIAVCCCLPCIIAILYALTDQEGAAKEDIDRLPKFKFHRLDDPSKVNGEAQESFQGMMIECDTDSPIEHAISMEDAECCICLTAYDDGTELRELPCHHHFHCSCIDKWLYINAFCPLCKFNILKAGQSSNEQA